MKTFIQRRRCSFVDFVDWCLLIHKRLLSVDHRKLLQHSVNGNSTFIYVNYPSSVRKHIALQAATLTDRLWTLSLEISFYMLYVECLSQDLFVKFRIDAASKGKIILIFAVTKWIFFVICTYVGADVVKYRARNDDDVIHKWLRWTILKWSAQGFYSLIAPDDRYTLQLIILTASFSEFCLNISHIYLRARKKNGPNICQL